jgi:hypothetical protein
VKAGDVVKISEAAVIKTQRMGEYGIVIRLIPPVEARRSKGFPCGKWFDVFVCGIVYAIRNDCLEKI